MDACRIEIGQKAAQIVLNETAEKSDADAARHVTLKPTLSLGDTLRRNHRK